VDGLRVSFREWHNLRSNDVGVKVGRSAIDVHSFTTTRGLFLHTHVQKSFPIHF